MYFVVEPRTQETQDVARSGTAADFDFVESRLSLFIYLFIFPGSFRLVAAATDFALDRGPSGLQSDRAG